MCAFCGEDGPVDEMVHCGAMHCMTWHHRGCADALRRRVRYGGFGRHQCPWGFAADVPRHESDQFYVTFDDGAGKDAASEPRELDA